MTTGMDRFTGKEISTEAHIQQSVADILTTPQGSMPFARTYGSQLFELLDRPLHAGTIALIRAATVIALQKWEPRVRVSRVAFTAIGAEGSASLTIEARRLDLPVSQPFALSVPL